MSEQIDHHCGVGAVVDISGKHRNVVKKSGRLTRALHNRGQCGWGVAGADGVDDSDIWIEQEPVPVLQSQRIKRIKDFQYAQSVIVHTRYGTNAEIGAQGLHPIRLRDDDPNVDVAFAFNGNIPDCEPALEELRRLGVTEVPRGDTAAIAYLLQAKRREYKEMLPAIASLQEFLDGAYNGVVLTRAGEVHAFRDPLGFHPLAVGEIDGYGVVASTDGAIHKAVDEPEDHAVVHDVKPGEYVRLRPGHAIEQGQIFTAKKARGCLQKGALCAFEHVYFAGWKDAIDGTSVSHARYEWGKALAELDSDLPKNRIVVPVPDSAKLAARGYSEEAGVHYVEVLRKTEQGRTFIAGGDERKQMVHQKYDIGGFLQEGQEIVLVDDSVVRGATMEELVKRIRETLKPTKIHLRLACPPVIAPCYYGIDMKTPAELLARKHFGNRQLKANQLDPRTRAEMARTLGVDSMRYLPYTSLIEVLGRTRDNICTACMTGKYPTERGQQLYDIAFKQWKEKD